MFFPDVFSGGNVFGNIVAPYGVQQFRMLKNTFNDTKNVMHCWWIRANKTSYHAPYVFNRKSGIFRICCQSFTNIKRETEMIELLWNAPVSEKKMARFIQTLDLHPRQYVMDFGCGCGEFLIRLAEKYQIQGTGIDSTGEFVDEAIRRATNRVSTIHFVENDVSMHEVPHDSIDLAVCLGATHAFGIGPDAYRNAVERMASYVAPGGMLLVAEGYLIQTPAPEYRELLGDSIPDEMTHAANVATGKEFGLIPTAAWTSTKDEWDEFEWSYQRIIEERADMNPDDESAIEKRDIRRKWMDAYLKWGRETLGYGTYLFKKPFSKS